MEPDPSFLVIFFTELPPEFYLKGNYTPVGLFLSPYGPANFHRAACIGKGICLYSELRKTAPIHFLTPLNFPSFTSHYHKPLKSFPWNPNGLLSDTKAKASLRSQLGVPISQGEKKKRLHYHWVPGEKALPLSSWRKKTLSLRVADPVLQRKFSHCNPGRWQQRRSRGRRQSLARQPGEAPKEKLDVVLGTSVLTSSVLSSSAQRAMSLSVLFIGIFC